MDSRSDAVARGYDAIAEPYAERFGDELRHKPLDRALLAVLAEELGAGAVVGDVGCGPGHVTAYLRAAGLDAVGVDLSPAMIALAQERYPDARFVVGSMLDLPADDGSWQGIVALYSIIHLTPEQLPRAFAEFRRVLRGGGAPLLLSFHVGDELRHVDEMYGRAVSLDFQFLRAQDIAAQLQDARFSVEMSLERRPYTAVEAETQRAYILARSR